jgi:ubiquitin-like modifier-activating enzyme ATG7
MLCIVQRDCSQFADIQVPTLTLPPGLDLQSTMNPTTNHIEEQLPIPPFPHLDTLLSLFTVSGWEPNERGKPGPRSADLKGTMDSTTLMSQAVDLNLRLMKWRMWPSLQVDKLAKQRCLLLGSGTLGCSVARSLMSWGIRYITMVDNGIVSYSNPVRQSLFEFEDCQLGKFKAVAAAERLQKIFPGMDTHSVLLSIPMPGHPYPTNSSSTSVTTTTTATATAVTPESQSSSTAAASSSSSSSSSSSAKTILMYEDARSKLDELIQSHDIIFNLTDSREARWLPTLLAKTYGRLCINSALGFDSYLVMRHGLTVDDGIGCYFCNDVTAADNSQRDRTLDQQCTVTRPGLSFMASALCAELLVAYLHAPSSNNNNNNEETSTTAEGYSINNVPQQIRGNVINFSQLLLEVR